MTIKDVLNVFLVYGQKMDYIFRNYREPRTPFEIFDNEIVTCYHCTYDGTNFEKRYSFHDFKNMFYNAICYDEELPEYVQERISVLFGDLMNEKLDVDFYNTAVTEIKAAVTNVMLNETIQGFWRKKNEMETEKIRKLVFNNCHKCNSFALVQPLITWAENHNRLDCNFIFKMFEYGYITGKRDERAKRKERERREKGNKKETDEDC